MCYVYVVWSFREGACLNVVFSAGVPVGLGVAGLEGAFFVVFYHVDGQLGQPYTTSVI